MLINFIDQTNVVNRYTTPPTRLLTRSLWKAHKILSMHAQVADSALHRVQSSLRELHLQHNQLQTLPETVFDGASVSQDSAVLRVIDVSSNPLGPALEQSDGLQSTLTVLRMRNVGLSRWPSGLLRGLDALAVLDVAENRLTTIPRGALAKLVRLERLDASLNRIVNVDPWSLVLPSSHRPPSIDLSGNPLDCTCSLGALCRHLLPVSPDGLVYLNASRRTGYQCETPAEWHGVRLITFCADAESQCSTVSSTVVAAALGAVAAVLVALTAAVLGRRCRRRGPVSGKAAAAAAEGCQKGNYR